MQLTARTIFGALVVVWCCCETAGAAEQGSRWWPFGRRSRAETSARSVDALPSMGASTLHGAPTTSRQGSVEPQTQAAPSPTPGVLSMPQRNAVPQYLPESKDRRWMFESPFANVGWPAIHMPEFRFRKPKLQQPPLLPQRSDVDEARNAWVEPGPDPARPSPLQAVKESARRVSDSTRSAWRKTVDALTPGDSASTSSSRTASNDRSPSFWQRMLGAEAQRKEGSQTIPEFMAQERLDP